MAQSPDSAAWGVLAKLAGNRWQTADGVIHTFEWSADRREIVESELVGGLPQPANIYALQGNELVQHQCLPNHSPCIQLFHRFGTADGNTVVFKEISAMSKRNDPSVALRERPVADWAKWKRKYLFIGETSFRYQLVNDERLEVTKSFTSKMTSAPLDAPWDEPRVEPAVVYQRAGAVVAQSNHAKTADFGPMEVFVGRRLISEDLSEILELQHQLDGLVIQWFALDGQPIGRYAFGFAAGSGQLELRDYPYVNSQNLKMKSKSVGWQPGGILFFMTEPDGSGRLMTHEFSLANGKIRAGRSDTLLGSTLTGKPKVESFSSGDRLFIPSTPELLAEAVAAHERRLEDQRLQAELAAEERQERKAQQERTFSAFMGGLNTLADTVAQNQAEQARQQAYLDDLRRQAERAERRRDVQQQHDANAEARRNADIVNQANQRQDEEAARLAEQRRQYERQRADVAQATQTSPRSNRDMADAGRASTDTDANRCVSQSEVRQNDTFKGNTAAYVTNGCGSPVDVRICLMTDKGWKCGSTMGLAPQASWSSSAFHATGPVFVDARTSGSSKPLASPR